MDMSFFKFLMGIYLYIFAAGISVYYIAVYTINFSVLNFLLVVCLFACVFGTILCMLTEYWAKTIE